MQINKRAKKV